MLDKILNLKNTNKIFFYLLLPLVVIAGIIKLAMQFNLIGAKKDLDKAEKKDQGLAGEESKLKDAAKAKEAEAALHEAKAKEHEKKAEAGNDDANWHLKQ